MRNEEKDELRREVIRLGIVGYDKKKIVELMNGCGFTKQTASNYYEALKHKFAIQQGEAK